MTNGDIFRTFTNEQIADAIADDRMIPIKALNKKINFNVEIEPLRHATYCMILEWLNREAE